MNARTRMSDQFLKLMKVDTLSKEYKNILVAKAAEILAGEPVISTAEISTEDLLRQRNRGTV